MVEVKGYWSGDDFQVFVSLNYLYSPEPIVVPNFFLPPQELESIRREASNSWGGRKKLGTTMGSGL